MNQRRRRRAAAPGPETDQAAPRPPRAPDPAEDAPIEEESAGSEPSAPAAAPGAPAGAPQTPAEAALQLAQAGLSDDLIKQALAAQFGASAPPQAPPPPVSGVPVPGTPGAGEQLGPNMAMVAAYQERMKNYVPPKTRFRFNALRRDDPDLRGCIEEALAGDVEGPEEAVEAVLAALDGFGGVDLPKWAHEWCVMWMSWQASIRRMPEGETFGEDRALEDMVRHHWHEHVLERAALNAARNPGVKSGPVDALVGDGPSAGSFNFNK